jgi:uncharacterized protein (DUF697 family)
LKSEKKLIRSVTFARLLHKEVLDNHTLNFLNKMNNREKAENYVNGHTATAVAIVVGTALVPGAASIALVAQEVVMAHQIARIYGQQITQSEARAIAAKIGLASVVGKIAALEAAILTGPFAFAIKPAIAAGIVKILGGKIIDYFED